MPTPAIIKLEIRGFRAFGKEAQTLTFNSHLAAVWGPNSQGKTSLAEAFEFLLTGQITRRQLLASTVDEFADALKNAHLPAAEQAYVEAHIVGADGVTRCVRRTLISDYGKRQDCQTALQIDGAAASEAHLLNCGIILSQPPLQAPVLTQHTLSYLFSVRPQDRANYFRALLEVTDLEMFRAAVAELDRDLAAADDPLLGKFHTLDSLPGGHFFFLSVGVPTEQELAAAFEKATADLLAANGKTAGAGTDEDLELIEQLLEEERGRTFPLQLFNTPGVSSWTVPPASGWVALQTYIKEKAKADVEAARVIGLMKSALALPALANASGAVDCPLCDTKDGLTPQRIAHISEQVRSTEAYQRAEAQAHQMLNQIAANVRSLEQAVNVSCPQFLQVTPTERRKRGFLLRQVRTLLPNAETELNAWLRAIRPYMTARRHFLRQACVVREVFTQSSGALSDLNGIEELQATLESLTQPLTALHETRDGYMQAAAVVQDKLRTSVDQKAATTGWTTLIECARKQPAILSALRERHCRTALQAELAQALKHIDQGNEQVLEEKFSALSTAVDEWWTLLRPDEPTFFGGLKPRPGARRTIDFKAGLAPDEGRRSAKVRDAIAVFSQSQLHCLGLAVFLARTQHEKSRFVVLDDPILASDDDYRAHFNTAVLERLHDLGIQTIVLTQDQRTWRDIEERYVHKNVSIFRIELRNPAHGTEVHNTSDDLATMLHTVETLARGGHPDLRRQAGERLRNAVERFCKLLLVKHRRANGEPHALLSDYDNKMSYKELGPVVEPLLVKDPSHPGKLRATNKACGPGKHDQTIPDKGELMVGVGDLRSLKKSYLD